MQHSLVELCDGLLCYLILHIPVSVCTCKERKKKKEITKPCFAFTERVPRTAYLLLSSVLSMCILRLYFVLKETTRKKEPFIVQHVGIVSPLLFFSFLEYIKQLILLYLLFSFVNFLVLFKNGFIKGLL